MTKALKKSQRRWMTLMEVLIGMALTIMLVGGLLMYLRQATLLSLDVDTTRRELNEQRYAQARLGHVLTRAHLQDGDIRLKPGAKNGPASEDREAYFFFTDEEGRSLTFTYTHDPDIEPYFSADVIGEIYMDSQNQLCLSTWPSPAHWTFEKPPVRTEVLLKDVLAVSFEFYVPPRFDDKPVNPLGVDTGDHKIEAPVGRLTSWRQSYGELPAMIKVIVRCANLNAEAPDFTEYAIQLPYAEKTITYLKDKPVKVKESGK